MRLSLYSALSLIAIVALDQVQAINVYRQESVAPSAGPAHTNAVTSAMMMAEVDQTPADGFDYHPDLQSLS